MVCVMNSIVLVTLVAIIEVFPQNITLWRQNYAIFQELNCSLPRPVAFSVTDAFPKNYTKQYLDKLDPQFVVLHRCGVHSGCCKQNYEEYKENKTEQVKITFWNRNIPTEEPHAFRYHAFMNHTSCSCQSKATNDSSHM